LNKQDVTNLVKTQQQLKELDHRVDLYSDFIRGQQLQKQQLDQEINILQSNLNNVGKISNNKIYKTDIHGLY